MTAANTHIKLDRNFTAAELRAMPSADRDAILSAAAESAYAEYQTNQGIRDHEAFDNRDHARKPTISTPVDA